MVGPFFYINSEELEYHGWMLQLENERRAERYGDFLISPMGHEQLFDLKFKSNQADIEYTLFPRGRVVYNTVTKKHIVYIDRCIRHLIDHIADRYQLKEFDVMEDDHYVCPGCMEE